MDTKKKKKKTIYIPEELVRDILRRLPVKSLMRFSSVCKPWCDLFSNPEFISEHHVKASERNVDILVKHGSGKDVRFSFFSSAVRDGGEQSLCLTETVYIPFIEKFRKDPVVLGPCNGVLCVHDDRDMIALWNPATREFKPLPLSTVERPPDALSFSMDNLGFGYDRKTDDYKVTRFVINYLGDEDVFDESLQIHQIEMYSLKDNSWRLFPDDFVMFGQHPCFHLYNNGKYYWWGSWGVSVMVSYDFADDVYEDVDVGDDAINRIDQGIKLSIFNGLFAVISYPKEGLEKWFDIWVMGEHGLKESWYRQARIGPILGVERALGLWKNGELFLEDGEGQLLVYDPSTQQLKNLQFRGKKSTLQVVNYVESLVPIFGRREDEGFVRIWHV